MNIELKELQKLVYTENTQNWIFIENNIISSDPEDGGGEYELIIKNKSNNKFYLINYFDWDIQNGSLIEYTENLTEVFPKEIKKTIYLLNKD